MDTIKISVNKQMDGYTFSLSPTIRNYIKQIVPNSHPANNIFVSYDTKSDFELFQGKLESYVFPVLLGLEDKNDIKKFNDIIFTDTITGKLLYTVKYD
jgi:hypothetical protein